MQKRIVVLLEDGVEVSRFETFALYGENADRESISNVSYCSGMFQLQVFNALAEKILDITKGDVEMFTEIVSTITANVIKESLEGSGKKNKKGAARQTGRCQVQRTEGRLFNFRDSQS